MKYSILKLLFLLTCLKLISQNQSVDIYTIRYQSSVQGQGLPEPYISDYSLILIPLNGISIYNKISKTDLNKTVTTDPMDDSVFHLNITGKNNRLVFKEYKTNSIFFKAIVAPRLLVVKDYIDIFSWELKNETKEIMGFNCQKATTTFRGRNYEAWFSADLPSGGPWKYDGLPGLILEIKSLDNYIHLNAYSIESTLIENFTFKNPFLNDSKIHTWEEYKTIYKQKAIAKSKFNFQSGSVGNAKNIKIITPRKLIEQIIPEDDKDYIADKEFEKSQGLP